MRGHTDPLTGSITSVGSEGVQIREGQAAGEPRVRVIGWDVVRTVEGDRAAKAAPFMPVADRAWRARARVERSDLWEAEPLLEELFATYRTLTGPTAAVVDEALLRCRLARASDGAIWPFLAWTARLNEVGTPRSQRWVGGAIHRPPIRDETTGLIGQLHPMFVSDRACAAVAAATDWEEWSRSDAVTSQLAQLFRTAAVFECGGREGLVTFPIAGKGQPSHPGVRLVNEIVLSRVGDGDQRRLARGLLEQRIRASLANQAAAEASGAPADPEWLEAWCRAAVGRSLLRESDARDRRRGVTELLHVPARYADTVPALAAQSLAEAAIAMHELGEPASSAILVLEFRARYPEHPLREWARFRDLPASSPSPGPQPTPPERHAATR